MYLHIKRNAPPAARLDEGTRQEWIIMQTNVHLVLQNFWNMEDVCDAFQCKPSYWCTLNPSLFTLYITKCLTCCLTLSFQSNEMITTPPLLKAYFLKLLKVLYSSHFREGGGHQWGFGALWDVTIDFFLFVDRLETHIIAWKHWYREFCRIWDL